MGKVRFITLGCKVNQYETQAMRESLGRAGLEETRGDSCDVVVINTCTVTEGADRENRYWIRRAHRENPEAKIVVTGCWVERDRKEVEALPEVDLVLANREKPEIAQVLFQGCGTPSVQNEEVPAPIRSRHEYGPLRIATFQGRARAFIKIQDGCNHACSFCKVVLVRGRSRSRPLSEIVEEAERLRDSGYREIVLTGIQLGAYGKDFPEAVPLVTLLEALSQVGGIERIRLSSIEPTDVTGELIEAMREMPKVCPQLHIPLQSGDDEILKRMNRRYGRGFYLDLIRRLRESISNFALSMDVMAGFPGEEGSHFENTLSAVEETRPIRVHAFPYSRRPGTRASRFAGLREESVRERMNRLMAFSSLVTSQEKAKFIGRTLPVLVEKKSPRGELYQGHTPQYLKVYFQGFPDLIGESVLVDLEAVAGDGLIGRWRRSPIG